MRVHALAAELAAAAGRYAGDQDPVAWFESSDPGAHGINNAHPFVAQNGSRLAGGHVAFENMQVRAANRGSGDPDDGVGGRNNHGFGPFFQFFLVRAVINKSLHGECR